MFFIFGTPRSGTTLLAQTLSSAGTVVVPHETDFLVPMAFIFDRIKDENVGRELIVQLISEAAHFNTSIGEYLNAAIVREIVYSAEFKPSAIIESIYKRIAAAAGAIIAGDKSPNDLNFIRILMKTSSLPRDAKIIHIVRDIRDVMASLQRLGWLTNPEGYFPRFWNNNNLYLKTLYERDSRYLLLRYEDFVNDPSGSLTKICELIGVEFQKEMLVPEKRHDRYKNMPMEHPNIYQKIGTQSIGSYRQILKKNTIRACERQALEGLIEFGYLC